MDEDRDRASPPLQSKGAYNIDFDALDDAFNPFGSKSGLSSLPPVGGEPVKSEENVIESASGGGDHLESSSAAPKEPSETPRKKKTKSSKRASAVVDNEGNEGSTTDLSAAGDGPQDNTAADVADKPVKTKKVVKKKSRPVSKNLEQKTDGQSSVDPAAISAAEGGDAQGMATSTSTAASSPQDNSVQEQLENSQPQSGDNLSAVVKNVPQPDGLPQQTDDGTTPQADISEPHREKSIQEEIESLQEALAPAETTLPAEKSPRSSAEKSLSPVIGEEGAESSSRKERSAGKVKKTKSKVKKSSASSKHAVAEGDVDGVDAASEKESRGSPRVSSQGDASVAHDSAVDDSPVKSKHPAKRVLEQQVREDQARGDSDMADSHNTESVVKLVQVLKYSQSDWNKLRQELELTLQAQLLAKEKEWGSKLADREARLATLEDTNKKLRQTNEDMRTVMGEFEKTIGQLQSEKEKTSNASQQSLQDVVKEREQALEDLQSVETAFSDLHRRYEKTKGVVDGFKQNEEVLKKCVQDLQNKLKKTEQKIQVIKEQAEEKLERASEEIEKTNKSASSEIARLEAALRKADLQIQGIESTLDQKVKENKELAAICDELIGKVQ